MSTAALLHEPELDIDGFLAFLEGREDRFWELHEGYPRAMVRPTRPHARIVTNLIVHLNGPSGAHGYEVLSDILIEADRRSGYAPDIAIVPESDDPRPKGRTDPVILIEVLSPSTMDYDRTAKAPAYRAIPGLQQLVLVYQDSVRIESWVRREEAWPLRPDILTDREAALDLLAIDARLLLSAVYEQVVPSPLID